MDSEQKKSDEAALALIVLLILGLGFLGYGLFSFDCNTCTFNWTDKCDDYCECVEYEQVSEVIGWEDKCLPMIETSFRPEDFEKIKPDISNPCGSECKTKEIEDCGKFHCEKINVTFCTYYNQQKFPVVNYTQGKCISATKKQT